jgi:hypothetical protein
MKYGPFIFFVNMRDQFKRACRDNWKVTYREKWFDTNHSRYQNRLPRRNFWEILEVWSMNFIGCQSKIIIYTCKWSHCIHTIEQHYTALH